MWNGGTQAKSGRKFKSVSYVEHGRGHSQVITVERLFPGTRFQSSPSAGRNWLD